MLDAATIAALPKVELHLHLEGTLEPESIFAMAERHGVALPDDDVDALRARYEFADLGAFLALYYDNMAVLLAEEDFADVAAAYLRRAAAGGLRHAEVFVDPQAHLARGVPLEVVLDGVLAGLAAGERELGVTTGLIVSFLRDRPPAEAMDVLDQVLSGRWPVLGVGLDSAEVGFPPAPFAPVFSAAGAAGLRRVAHAGEEGPPGHVTDSLDLLGVERIDHGIRSLEDPELVARLARERVPLTVCPLSNERLRVVDRLEDHPLPAMVDAGLLVTVSSDDPAYFGGYVDDQYLALHRRLSLGAPALADLAGNAVAAAFIDPSERARLQAEIDAWAAPLS